MIENNSNISIEIEKNKFIFYEGETINGSIQFENLPNIFNYIKINLVQEEYFFQESKNQKIEKKNCINSKIIEMIEPKKYNFSIEIPENINSSFEYPGNNFNLYIRYYLLFEYLSNNYVNKKLIIIRSVKKFSSSIFMQFGGSVYKFLFVNYGNCFASIKLQRDNFKMGEMIFFSLNINNETSINIKNVKINLIREINIKNTNGIINEKYTLSKCIIHWNISSHTISDCNFSLKLQDKELKDLNFEKWNFKYKKDIDIQNLLTSVSSDLFECKYFLKVTIYFSSFVKYNCRPRIIIPIYVCHKTSKDFEEEKQKEKDEEKKLEFNITDISSIIIDKKNKEESNFINDETIEDFDI